MKNICRKPTHARNKPVPGNCNCNVLQGSRSPHFHAKYGDFEVTVTIETGIVSGEFPKRALAHVLEWLELNKSELLEDWELAKERKPLKKVKPME